MSLGMLGVGLFGGWRYLTKPQPGSRAGPTDGGVVSRAFGCLSSLTLFGGGASESRISMMLCDGRGYISALMFLLK